MKKISRAAVLLTCAIAVQTPAPAQGVDRGGAEVAQPRTGQGMPGDGRIVGLELRDPQDNKLGKIDDVVLDGARGKVAYIVVRLGGFLGFGGRHHAVPFEALQRGENGRYYVIYADHETLIRSPDFERGKWPKVADQAWSSEVDDYWDRMIGETSGGIVTVPRSSRTSAREEGGSRPPVPDRKEE